jgi:hypothetical protein
MTRRDEGANAMMRKNFGWLVLGLALQLLFVSLAEAAAGRFQFVVGEVKVLDAAGKERPARKGGEVNEGESVLSGASGTAQILLVDGGILAVRPDTRMKIDEYKFDGKDDGSERSFFSIVKGGFRSITGLIGKKHKENYGIKTPSATIGIRGTDSETVHVVTPLPGVPEGTYNKVNTGATVMNGTVINPNQVGYTPNLQTPAAILPAMPPIFEAAKPGQGQKKEDKDSGEKKEQQKPGDKKGEQKNGDAKGTNGGNGEKKSDSSGEGTGQQQSNGTTSSSSSTTSGAATSGATSSPVTSVTTAPSTTTTLVTAATVTSGGVAPSSSFIDAPIGTGGVGSEISVRTECVSAGVCYTGPWAGAGGIVREAGKTQSMLLNSSTGMPVLVAEQDTYDNFQYSVGTATMQGYGQALVGGVKVSWGRYVGADSMVDNNGVQDPLVMNMAWADSALNYIQAYNYVQGASLPQSFSTYVGGSVTDEVGNVYSSLSGTLTITSLSNITLNVSTSVAGRNWNLYYGNGSTEGLQQFYGSGCATSPCGLGLQLGSSTYNGTAIGSLSSYAKGEAHGVLIGAGGSVTGALTSFSANVPGTASLSGAIVLK